MNRKELKARIKHLTKKNKGKKFEEKVQKTINSGALSFDKGDLKTNDLVIECKYTDKKSFRITQKILEKLWNDSLEANKLPKLIIGIPKNDREIFIISCDIEIQKK